MAHRNRWFTYLLKMLIFDGKLLSNQMVILQAPKNGRVYVKFGEGINNLQPHGHYIIGVVTWSPTWGRKRLVKGLVAMGLCAETTWDGFIMVHTRTVLGDIRWPWLGMFSEVGEAWLSSSMISILVGRVRSLTVIQIPVAKLAQGGAPVSYLSCVH